MQDHTQALREALQGFLDFHTKPAGISVELITEKELFTQALADIGKREDALIAAARAALSSHQAATDKESLTVAPVALGGEKGEPPCSEHPDAPHGYNRSASHNAGRYVCDCEGWAALGGEKGEAVAETENALRPDHPLAKGSCVHGESMAKHCAWCSARPVGKARMLTDEEADHITGMHNTGRSQGDSECAEAIQRKFCEVNGITLEAK